MDVLEYKSFLLRLWRETNDQSPRTDWRAEIEHIQSGERWGFNTLDEMLEFLQQEMDDTKDSADADFRR